MRERMSEAAKHPGWIGGQVLQGDAGANTRIIVGIWKSRGLDALGPSPSSTTGCRVLMSEREVALQV